MTKKLGLYRVRFKKSLWDIWLKRFNEQPDMKLLDGIHDFRSRLAKHDMRKERE